MYWKQIPVYRFLDMHYDRITEWRLDEIGFKAHVNWRPDLILKHDWMGKIVTRRISYNDGVVSLNGEDVNINTFSELLMLIKFLTPAPR